LLHAFLNQIDIHASVWQLGKRWYLAKLFRGGNWRFLLEQVATDTILDAFKALLRILGERTPLVPPTLICGWSLICLGRIVAIDFLQGLLFRTKLLKQLIRAWIFEQELVTRTQSSGFLLLFRLATLLLIL